MESVKRNQKKSILNSIFVSWIRWGKEIFAFQPHADFAYPLNTENRFCKLFVQSHEHPVEMITKFLLPMGFRRQSDTILSNFEAESP